MIAFFAAVIVVTVIRAVSDPEIAEQICSLRFGIGDIVMLLLAAGGYFILKRSGRK